MAVFHTIQWHIVVMIVVFIHFRYGSVFLTTSGINTNLSNSEIIDKVNGAANVLYPGYFDSIRIMEIEGKAIIYCIN